MDSCIICMLHFEEKKSLQISWNIHFNTLNKSAKRHCGRHTLICKKILIKKT